MTIESDDAYRQRLIAIGVKPEYIELASGHDLDCIGNIMKCYRRSMDMRTQDPAAYKIEKWASISLISSNKKAAP